MNLTDVKNALDEIIKLNPGLDGATLKRLLLASGWEEKNITEAMFMFEHDYQNGVSIVKEENKQETPFDKINDRLNGVENVSVAEETTNTEIKTEEKLLPDGNEANDFLLEQPIKQDTNKDILAAALAVSEIPTVIENKIEVKVTPVAEEKIEAPIIMPIVEPVIEEKKEEIPVVAENPLPVIEEVKEIEPVEVVTPIVEAPIKIEEVPVPVVEKKEEVVIDKEVLLPDEEVLSRMSEVPHEQVIQKEEVKKTPKIEKKESESLVIEDEKELLLEIKEEREKLEKAKKEQELPEGLPLKPFESSKSVWPFSHYKSVFNGNVMGPKQKDEDKEKSPDNQSKKTVYVGNIVFAKAPISKEENRLVHIAIAMFFVIIALLTYMYAVGRL